MENSWITAQEFQATLQGAGSNAKPNQIERWRREGLLPRPKQIGLGRGQGSFTQVPSISTAQTVEIERLFSIRRKRAWVGWQLWLRGFEVSERYWREPLEAARSDIIQIQEAARQREQTQLDTDLAPDDAKRIILQALQATPLHAPVTKISAEYVETLGGFLQEIISGQFAGFSRDDNSMPNPIEQGAVLSVMGIKSKFAQHIADFAGSIETELQQISEAFEAIAVRNSLCEPNIETRQEFHAAVAIGQFLHSISSDITGGKALTVFNRIAANSAISLQATMLLLWSEYRAISKTAQPISEILAALSPAMILNEITQGKS